MSTIQLQMKRRINRVQQRRRQSDRRGSTLLVVLVLMTMLASLGVIFYVFAAQERASANYYSDGAKVKQFDIDKDTLFDFGIRQLIEGPQPGSFRNSALSGRRHALLPNMLGLDTTGKKLDFSPFNGTALSTSDPRYTSINDSAAANGGTERQANQLANLDPDYTYPDNNNVFLFYQGYDPVQGRWVMIPSFHRPQTTPRTSTWFSDATPSQVLRPHSGHIWVPPTGQQPPSPAKSRYLTAADITALAGTWTGWGTFPFTPPDKDGDTNTGEQGVWSLTSAQGAQPAALPANANNYEYDVDNDFDSSRVREGVWMDLDFPPLEDSSGMLYVPFFSFTVMDADALLNLNVHGNLARVWNGDVNLNTVPFRFSTSDPFVSKSNEGLFASEVNPLWALNRRPPVTGGSLPAGQYDGSYGADPFFGTYVSAPAPENWIEAANRDWLYLLMGRYTQSPADLVPGRWGEEHLLYGAINNSSPLNPLYFSIDSGSGSVLQYPWPGPGQTQLDDNGDTNKVTGDWFGSTYQAFGKPLDYTGLGSYWVAATPKTGNYGFTAGNPARWPRFNRYSSSSSTPVSWPASGLSGTLAFGLYNDAGEMVIDGDYKKDEDSVFGAEEMRALFLSAADFATATGGESRLTQLAPFNFDATVESFGSGTNQRYTQSFRNKFTTRSWDRKQHSVGYNTARTWEFNADADSDSKLEFPPRLGSIVPYSTTDLFRPVLRRLIEVENNNFDQPRYQLRLNLNQLLVGPNGNPLPTFPTTQRPPNVQLQYRPLTPHPDQTTLTATPITIAANYPANGNFTSGNDQEYWARRDRQLMARDIFALLYSLAWPDGINPTVAGFNSSGNNNAMIRQFAQYAVNLVDSLDRDNIVTRFEFDIDPNDGWDVDDDPYTTGDTDRFEVYGVERMDLTLSEAAAVRTDENMTSNISFTQWDDTTVDGTHFSYVELRNPGPTDVSFANRAWRVEVGPNYTDATLFTPATNYQGLRRLDLRAGSVTQGSLYTIGSVDNSPGGNNPSIMKVGLTGSAPAGWDTDMTTWILPAQRPLDLDLKNAAQTTNYVLTDGTGSAVGTGALYDNTVYNVIFSKTTPLYFRLYRRLSPDRPFPSTTAEEADNPFVLIDEIAINNSIVTGDSTMPSQGPRGRVTFASSDTTTQITDKLANLRSRERSQPFSNIRTDGYLFHTPSGAYGNTLANDNGNSPTAFTNWQKVFDRDFASLGELLHVTLGGFSNPTTLQGNAISSSRAPLPGLATSLDVDGTNQFMTLTSDTASATTTVATIPSDAEILFRPVVAPAGADASTPAPRWHRLLDIVEVPSRMQATIPGFPTPVDYPRVAGKINLNTIRDPAVWAALLDDPTIMSLQIDEDTNLNGMLDSGEDVNPAGTGGQLDLWTPAKLTRNDNGSSSDDWWQALLASRDGGRTGGGIATWDATSGLYLPGTTSSTPFRSFGQSFGTYQSVEQSLLRSWPGDPLVNNGASANRPRQLLELGTAAEHQGSGGTTLDPYVRSRLLNKVLNNVTTRSNVFVVFMSIKYFRANKDAATGAVQIGGPLKPPSDPNRFDPEFRRFFVIDRSQIEKAFDPQTGGFNFRSIIEFQQDLN